MERDVMLDIFKENGVRSQGLMWLSTPDVQVFLDFWVSIGRPKNVEISWGSGSPHIIQV